MVEPATRNNPEREALRIQAAAVAAQQAALAEEEGGSSSAASPWSSKKINWPPTSKINAAGWWSCATRPAKPMRP